MLFKAKSLFGWTYSSISLSVCFPFHLSLWVVIILLLTVLHDYAVLTAVLILSKLFNTNVNVVNHIMVSENINEHRIG